MREDWIEVELGEVCEINMGQSPPSSTYNSEKIGLPFFQGKAEFTDLHPIVRKWCTKPTRIANENDILLSVRAPVGSTNIANQQCAIGRGLAAISYPFSNKIIWYYLKSIEQLLDKQGTGTTFRAVSGNIVRKQIFPLAPLPIQRAIISKIEALFSDLDNGIANFNKAQGQLKIYRQAVLKKAFEGELTKEWREDYVKTHDRASQLPTAEELLKQIKQERQNHYNQQVEDWKKAVKEWEKNGKVDDKPSKPTTLSLNFDLTKTDQELKELPQNWSYITLDFATYKLGDGLHGTPQFDENGEYWFINGNNLNNGKILLKPETKKVNFSEFEKYKKDLNAYTILVSINGTIGKVSFYNEEKIILGKSACYFNLLSSFDKNYIRWIIDSFGFMHYAIRNATGSTIKNVPLSAMRNFVFPLCSTQEQNHIVQEIEFRLSVCDKMEQSITESLEKAEALRQSILKKAFEGKLLSQAEIEQCKAAVDYEPASELLKKIQAGKVKTHDRASQQKKVTTKKKSKK